MLCCAGRPANFALRSQIVGSRSSHHTGRCNCEIRAFGGVTPLRAVSLSVAGASEAETHTHPNSAHLKRSPRTQATGRAKKRKFKGKRASCLTTKISRICPPLKAPLAGPMGRISYYMTADREMIGYCYSERKSTSDRLRWLRFGGQTESPRPSRPSGSGSTRSARRLRVTASRAYTPSYQINHRGLIRECGAK